ncbi:MAG: FMN-binding glutamate synthase family protein [Planctomycetales bacterium]|nr:FMN-binding glutamate synthase family protein [Planctomycetales bacterium]
MATILMAAGGCLFVIAAIDMWQRRYAVIRNFPIIGHFRYWISAIGPELRQYIVAGNDEERPFSRDERSWIERSAERGNNYFGFGTDNDMEGSSNYLIIKHSAFPLTLPHVGQAGYDADFTVPCRKILGGYRQRARAFRPASIVNISAMSYGSLSGPAIEALNRGAKLAGCMHSTGEGGISRFHRFGGELVWQIGTGYFGCRDDRGGFSLEKLQERIASVDTVRAIEIKLSEGAKPGHGGVLPKKKITPEIAEIRGVSRERDCVSPAGHSAFRNVDELLDFVETIAEATGLPVGIKSAVGESQFWHDLASAMAADSRGVDFVVIDGGEGGTGAAPLAFADHVALPFKLGFARVHKIFAEHSLTERVVFIGSGKLGLPETALTAFALGCDMVNVAREAMLAIGCIQAQKCHTNHCPTGVATQNRWLVRGLDPDIQSVRFANYVKMLRRELLELSCACGVEHPALVTPEQIDVVDDRYGARTLADAFGYH